ncbi:MAG: NAD-dependent epimerase/dehydratase family protein [Zetaproteobacteria bacterium]|nr:NAD-dependent epimerase/dehydratase family protein [Zetaproteobacteria bacterium]
MKVLITGADGFIGRNLQAHLREMDDVSYDCFAKGMTLQVLKEKIASCDFIFHLAGVNRPKNDDEFVQGNMNLTQDVCRLTKQTGKQIPIVYTSSIQADADNAYGKSKLAAEQVLTDYTSETGAKVYNFRLPNVFGKWAKPNYNSAVATFCYNTVHNLPMTINDTDAVIRLVYIDDVVAQFIAVMSGESESYDIQPEYEITVGALADKLQGFKASRENITTEPVGTGLDRALHATYLSYLEPKAFAYDLVKHEDPRGVFVEMLRTQDSGQFSYFTAHPGITRGGHYHHSKTEKFLVVKGRAEFKFRHIMTDEKYALKTDESNPKVVETVPGWTHDITNVGDDEMIVLLWANERFDPKKPDTYACPL